MAVDNLERFLDGKGGVKEIDNEWFRSFPEVKAIEESIKKDIYRQIQLTAPTLADGESKTITLSYSPQISFKDSFYWTELFWASGSSTMEVSGTLKLSRNGDTVKIQTEVFFDWNDIYNWDRGGVNIPYMGRIYDVNLEMLEVCKGARPFTMASNWKLTFNINVKVDPEQPVKQKPGTEPIKRAIKYGDYEMNRGDNWETELHQPGLWVNGACVPTGGIQNWLDVDLDDYILPACCVLHPTGNPLEQ